MFDTVNLISKKYVSFDILFLLLIIELIVNKKSYNHFICALIDIYVLIR